MSKENEVPTEARLEAVKGKHAYSYDAALAAAYELGIEDGDLVEFGKLTSEELVILPTYMTEKAVGADCFASEDVEIAPGAIKVVFTGIKATYPGELGLFPFIRSSVPKKKGLFLANGVGVIEADYYGNEDNDGNIGFLFYNYTDSPVKVERFERLGQLVLIPIERFANASRAHMTRGGQGSTGL